MSNRPSVLILSYIYPPSRYCDIAGQRPAKFAKFLPEFGWNTVVVTRFWDEESAVSPYTTPRIECSNNDYLDLIYRASQNENANSSVYGVPFSLTLPYRMSKLRDCMRDSLWKSVFGKIVSAGKLATPNLTGTNWLFYAKKLALRLAANRKFDVILATSPPPDTLRLGDYLSKRLNVPLVIDLRDLMRLSLPANRRFSTDYKAYAKIVRQAARTIVVSDELAVAEQRELELSATPTVIPNGFDSDDFSDIPKISSPDFTIAYTGSIYPVRGEPIVFFEGLKHFLQSLGDDSERKRVQFCYAGTSASFVKQRALEAGVWDHVRILGHVPREQAIALQIQSSALLAICDTAGNQGIATGKIYEYMAAQRPVLAVPGDRSVVDRVINTTNIGMVCRNPQEVHYTLREWYKQWKLQGYVEYAPNSESVAEFERRRQSERLSQLMNELI